jgi:hypothetical protein
LRNRNNRSTQGLNLLVFALLPPQDIRVGTRSLNQVAFVTPEKRPPFDPRGRWPVADQFTGADFRQLRQSLRHRGSKMMPKLR